MAERTVAELVSILTSAAKQYWDIGVSFLSDSEYDKLTEELRRRDPANGFLQRIEGLEPQQKVKHPVPMLSLQKAYDMGAIKNWFQLLKSVPDSEKLEKDSPVYVYVMPKYDGIAGRWDGHTLSTRGNGIEGENITMKQSIIRVPSGSPAGTVISTLRQSAPFLGEIIMSHMVFKKFQERAAELGYSYKTIRNAVAGLINAKEIPEDLLEVMHREELYLHMVPYGLHAWFMDEAQLFKEFDKVQSWVDGIRTKEYPCDGIVFKTTAGLYEKLGNTAHHPRGAIAFKFKNESQETVLLDVEWSPGKECLTPVAVLEPVTLGGVTVTRASLHNMKNILDMGLCTGDQHTQLLYL